MARLLVTGARQGLGDGGIIVHAVAPGDVRTAMGGSDAPLLLEDGITGVRAVVDEAGPEQSGTFSPYDGSI